MSKTFRIEIVCEQDGEKLLFREGVPESAAKMAASQAPALDMAIKAARAMSIFKKEEKT